MVFKPRPFKPLNDDRRTTTPGWERGLLGDGEAKHGQATVFAPEPEKAETQGVASFTVEGTFFPSGEGRNFGKG
ncbi:MAG: hypothetical protein M1358_01025, partial [Chloroflexi bacterium]|nr:hypothetical protein [Chloroflexota bacterium]